MSQSFSKSSALVPSLFKASAQKFEGKTGTLVQVGTTLLGVMFLSLLAQVSIRLPFTPVPISGQTFGVLLCGLLLGRNLAVSAMLSYLTVGAFGLPVFAGGGSILTVGPTIGYLIGMLASSFVVGSFSDRGYARNFLGCIALGVISSSLVFSFGLAGLSLFVPSDALLAAGFYPFLVGDVIKTISAALIVSAAYKINRRSSV